MKYRKLGKTGLKVAEIGMGTWQLADDPDSWVGADLSESKRALSRYVELGGNFIDTAWIYGYDENNPDGHPSEELIGKFLKESGKREEVILATKVAPKNMIWEYPIADSIDKIFPEGWIEKSVNDSLRSLGVSEIDLMQFHVWKDDFAEDDGWKETVSKLTKEGKVRYWGISLNDYQPETGFATLDTGLISTVQFIFNIFHQKPEEKLLPYAKVNNIGLIARVPLDEGGLTGKYTLKTTWPDGDLRREYFEGDRLKELVERTNLLKTLLIKNEAGDLTELALRWILSHEEISTVIPGMRAVKYVEGNTSISDGRLLSSKLREELRNQAWERNFYLD